MSKFAEGTDPEYIKKVNEELYGTKGSIGGGSGGVTPYPNQTPKVAGYMGIPQIGWIAIIGVGVYYAYSKGMFKKL